MYLTRISRHKKSHWFSEPGKIFVSKEVNPIPREEPLPTQSNTKRLEFEGFGRRRYPGGTVWHPRRSLPNRYQPSPFLNGVGSSIARFQACSAFTRVAARRIAEPPVAALFIEALERSRHLIHWLRLLPAGATVAMRDSHPMSNSALSRRTERIGLKGSTTPLASRIGHYESQESGRPFWDCPSEWRAGIMIQLTSP